ncbi:MAG: hypothetical protein AAF327_11125 [Cyanobacteria bacterium P01_A01_bin.37]
MPTKNETLSCRLSSADKERLLQLADESGKSLTGLLEAIAREEITLTAPNNTLSRRMDRFSESLLEIKEQARRDGDRLTEALLYMSKLREEMRLVESPSSGR